MDIMDVNPLVLAVALACHTVAYRKHKTFASRHHGDLLPLNIKRSLSAADGSLLFTCAKKADGLDIFDGGGWEGGSRFVPVCSRARVRCFRSPSPFAARLPFSLSLSTGSPQPAASFAADRRSGHATPPRLLRAPGHRARYHHQLFDT